MPRPGRTFLIVPAGGQGEGIGHLTRCLALSRSLGSGASLFTGRLDEPAFRMLDGETKKGGRPRILKSLTKRSRWDVVVLDARETSREEYVELSGFGRVICLDEGGPARGLASYLIDTLPAPPGREPANVSSLGLLELPRPPRQRRLPAAFRKILVSFGGEDRAGLSGAFLDAVLGSGLVSASAITVVEGPLFSRTHWPPGVKVVRGLSNLDGLIARQDLVVTHFGITALHAMALGVPVVLLNPTAYHRSLGRLLDIPDIGVGRPDVRALTALLSNPKRFGRALARLKAEREAAPSRSLAALLKALPIRGAGSCPACGREGGRAVARFPEKTYHECAKCGMLFMESFAPKNKVYDKGYFDEEYRRQYGKSYLEDFPAIKNAGRERIAYISRLLGVTRGGTVLDVGCAYGPFLDALREAGFKPFGLDVSKEAVGYVKGKLGIPAVRAEFEAFDGRLLPPGPLRALTLWYVLEHFADLAGCLGKASSLLEGGGVLAFSTPNGRGISARKDLRAFLERSPSDHFTILSPAGLRQRLARFGFDLRIVRVTGHHPERFPGFLGRWAEKRTAVRSVLLAASRLFGLGDTFEAYVVKKGEPR